MDLYAPDVNGCEKDVSIHDYYGVQEDFGITKLAAPNYPSALGRTIYGFRFAQVVRRSRPDLAYGRDWPALLMAAQARLKVIVELHAPFPGRGIKRSLINRLVLSHNLIRVVVNSQALFDDVAHNFPALTDRLLIARNGAEPLSGDNVDVEAPSLRRDGRMAVGYVGHLYSGHGMEILGDFARRCPWADFHVIGGWPEDVAEWRERLQGSQNLFFHGHVQPSKVPAFLRVFDVLIAPYQPVITLHGGIGDNARWVCPLKLFDYMAAAKPILCSDHPVIREILSHEENALLCPPTDVEVWAHALSRLRESPALANRIANGALETFERNYTWERRAQRVLEGLEPSRASATSSSGKGAPHTIWSQLYRHVKLLVGVVSKVPLATGLGMTGLVFANFANLIAFFLPLKIVITLNSDQIPKMLSGILTDQNKNESIVILTAAAFILFASSIYLNAMSNRRLWRGGALLAERVFKGGATKRISRRLRQQYVWFCQLSADALVVALAWVGLLLLSPITCFGLVIIAVSEAGVIDFIRKTKSGRLAKLKVKILKDYSIVLQYLAALNFFAVFLLLLGEYLFLGKINVLVAILVLLLVRQLLSSFTRYAKKWMKLDMQKHTLATAVLRPNG